MSINLAPAIAGYFAAANAFDTSKLSEYFSEDAVVQDEKQERRGLDAIRAWMEETGDKYAAVSEVIAAVPKGNAIVVSAKVTGNFPGSPVTLDYTFTLRDERIVHLEIH